MKAKSIRLLGAAIVGAAAIAAGGCGGGSSDSSASGGSAANPDPPPAPAPAPVDQKVIPASAGASGAALVSYVKSLPADEVTTEPNTFAEGFSEPAEDGDEPVPAS